MAFSNVKTTVTTTQVSLNPTPAAEVLIVRARNNALWLGPTGVTPDTGFRIDPSDGPQEIPHGDSDPSELFAIARTGFPAQVEVLRRPRTA